MSLMSGRHLEQSVEDNRANPFGSAARPVVIAAGLEAACAFDVRRAMRQVKPSALVEVPSLLAGLNALRSESGCSVVIAAIHRSLEHTVSCLHGFWALRPDTRVVLLADLGQEREAADLLRLGCFAVVQTPPDPTELAKTLRNALNAPPIERPAAPSRDRNAMEQTGAAANDPTIGEIVDVAVPFINQTGSDLNIAHQGRKNAWTPGTDEWVESVGPDSINEGRALHLAHTLPAGEPGRTQPDDALDHCSTIDPWPDHSAKRGDHPLRSADHPVENNLTALLLSHTLERQLRPHPEVADAATSSDAAAGDSASLADASAVEPSTPNPQEYLGDSDLVQRLLADPLNMTETLLTVIRQRSKLEEIELFGPRVKQLPPGRRQTVELTYAGHRLGLLSCLQTAQSEISLESWGQWLSLWLALTEQMQGLSDLAYRDELTRLHNRRYFLSFLQRVITRAGEDRTHVSLMLFDIDNFKFYNDHYGHPAGDEVLVETARLMRSSVREHDVVARIGGDEFAVVFWDKEPKRQPGSRHPVDVAYAAERFQQAVCNHRFPKLADQAMDRLTISAGLATYPWDGTTPDQLIDVADRMLIHSKQQGKNVLTFGPGTVQQRTIPQPAHNRTRP